MLKCIKRDKRTYIEKRLDEQLIVELNDVENLEDLSMILTLMERRSELGSKRKISPDTMIVVVGNLMGIVLILTYERTNVIATKALGFVLRGRV